MNGGRGNAPPPVDGGEFLLQLLQKPPHQPQTPPHHPPSGTLPNDPAVAAVGPTIPFSSPTNGHDRTPYLHHHHHAPTPPSPWPHHQSPPLAFAPHIFFPQNPNPNLNFSSSPPMLPPQGLQSNFTPHERLGFLGTNPKPSAAQLNGQNLIFGTLNSGTLLNGSMKESLAQLGHIEGLYRKDRDLGLWNARGFNSFDVEFNNSMNVDRNLQPNMGGLKASEQERSSGSGWGTQGHGGSNRAVVPPPGFTNNSRSGGNKEYDSRRSFEQFSNRNSKRNVDIWDVQGVSEKLDYNDSPKGTTLNTVSADRETEAEFDNNGLDTIGNADIHHQSDFADLEEQLVGSLGLDDLSIEKNDNKGKHHVRDKDYRSDKRGQWLLGQRARIARRQIECRFDIDKLNAPFLAIYESLIPAEEEKAKQKQLLTLLEKLVIKEWPDARLYVYGSCANSFGFSKSDIDICLALKDMDINKSEVLLKLAEILESDNLQNVQALTRARVPIVKLMDPSTGISCDICINNMLAVINTKLLRDYAKIDGRLRQLAFIVKHWAKSRGVNETYQGTLSSYAYVLMCIHFLQQRKPAILPCLQEMEATCSVNVDNIECAYFDQVEKLYGFGARNGESIAKLVWAFFNYWAYCHDYTDDVISVRTGNRLSKRAKDWTRRIGNDRHLICIEDPFETSHDLGRVVDKNSIRVLREEFERAAEIMQRDQNPCVKLFEPYVPS